MIAALCHQNLIAPRKNSDILTWPLTQPTFEQRDINANEGQVKMSGFVVTPFTVEGACNRTVFETWLETCLLPTLLPGQVVVMDNATFHKGGRRSATDSGCGLTMNLCKSGQPSSK